MVQGQEAPADLPSGEEAQEDLREADQAVDREVVLRAEADLQGEACLAAVPAVAVERVAAAQEAEDGLGGKR